LDCGASEKVKFAIGRQKVAHTVKFHISGLRIEEIKKVCGVPEEAISVNKEENIGVIRTETRTELLGICFGLMELTSDFEVIDEEAG